MHIHSPISCASVLGMWVRRLASPLGSRCLHARAMRGGILSHGSSTWRTNVDDVNILGSPSWYERQAFSVIRDNTTKLIGSSCPCSYQVIALLTCTEPPDAISSHLSPDDPDSTRHVPTTGIQQAWIGTATSTLTLQPSHDMADLGDGLLSDAKKLRHSIPLGHMCL